MMDYSAFEGDHLLAFGDEPWPLLTEDEGYGWQFGMRQPTGWRRLLLRPAQQYSLHLGQHRGAIFGITEAGLNISLLRLAANAARHGWKVVLFDAQGSADMAARFVATMHQAGRANTYVFPNAPYNGFRGSKMALFHRLLSVAPFREPYYQHITTASLSAILQMPEGSLRSLDELVEQLTSIKARLGGTRSRGAARPSLPLLTLLCPDALLGAPLRYAALSALAGNRLSGSWSYDQADAAYLSFNAWSRPQEARHLARYLLDDLASYLVERDKGPSRVLLLLKHPELLFEIGQVASLFALLEQKRGSVFVAARSPADLGREAGRILKNATTLLIHRSMTTLPFEPYVAFSGPRRHPFFDGTIQRLTDERCFAIHQGQVALVQIAPVQCDAADLLRAHKRIPALPPDDEACFSWDLCLPDEEEDAWDLAAIFGPVNDAETPLENGQAPSHEAGPRRHVRSARRSRRQTSGDPPHKPESGSPPPPSE